MRRYFHLLCLLGFLSLFPAISWADSVTLDWPGTGPDANNNLDVDDRGGSFNNNGNNSSYFLTVNGNSQVSTLTFYLFNGQAVDDGGDDMDDDVSTTGEDFPSGSGLQILAPPSELVPPLSQIVALSDNPLTAFSFHGIQTGLDVEQLAYLQDGSDFAIFEYRIINNTASAVPVKIGLGGDFDVNDSSQNDINGKDLSIPVVFEYDTLLDGTTNLFYAAGIALAGGNMDNYRLGACCDTTYVAQGNGFPTALDTNRLAYFNARPNEECDDGAHLNGDGCSANCLNETGSEVCGNGIVEAGEACDDGNTTGGDGCDANCLSENCGNGILDPGEDCDDNNLTDGDGCSSYCTGEFKNAGHFCGDGQINDGGVGDQVTTEGDREVTLSADLGILNPGQSATAAFCVVGGLSATDGPSAGQVVVTNAQDCLTLYQQTIAVCGNGIQNAGEQCDDGNTLNGDSCDANCTLPACGNNILDTGEQCDDGNLINGDGCDSTCNIESSGELSGGSCQLSPHPSNSGPTALLLFSLISLLGWGWMRSRCP
jgi:cysteine-rich repeat protein